MVHHQIPRSIVVGTGKGGTGKTTLATHIASNWASRHNEPVCLVDCDTQASATKSLGLYPGDEGQSLYDAVTSGQPLPTASNRTNLNVITAGKYTRDLANSLASRRAPDPADAQASLISVFASHRYAAVIFDLPPAGQSGLADTVMASAETLLVPTTASPASLSGLPVLTEQLITDASAIHLLGVILTAVPIASHRARAEAINFIESAATSGALFSTTVRAAQAALDMAYSHHRTVNELADWEANWKSERTVTEQIADPLSFPANTSLIAADMASLADEVRSRYLDWHQLQAAS